MIDNPRFHQFMAVVLKMGEDFHPDLDDANSNILIQYFHATVNALISSENAGIPRTKHISYEEIFKAKKIAIKTHFKPNIAFNELPPIEELDSISPANSIYERNMKLLYPLGNNSAFDWDNLPEDLS